MSTNDDASAPRRRSAAPRRARHARLHAGRADQRPRQAEHQRGRVPALAARDGGAGRDRRRTLRLYPDPVSARLREAAAAPLRRRAPTRCWPATARTTASPSSTAAFLDPGDRIACPWPTYGLYDTLAALQGAELIAGRVPADGAPLGAAARISPASAPRWSSSRTRTTRRRRWCPSTSCAACATRAPGGVVVVDEAYVDFALGAGIDASMLPYLGAAPEPGRAAHVLEELQPGGRAPRAAVRGGAAGRGAGEGEGQLQRQRRDPGARRRRAGGPQLPRAVRAPDAGRARAPGARARGARLDVAGVGARISCCARSASAPRRCTSRSSRRACWCAGGRRPSCARRCASASAIPTRTTACSPRSSAWRDRPT